MLPYDCTRAPWLVRIMWNDGETAFFVYEHTHACIAVDREFWPDWYTPPADKDGYYQPDEYVGVMSSRLGVARMIAAAPSMYEMLQETLRWFDEKYPADKYPLEQENHYRINMNDLAIASLRENIRSVLTLTENQPIQPTERSMHHETNTSRTPQNAL